MFKFMKFLGFVRKPQGARRHINPDGSVGGLVAESAAVATDAYIHYSAIVSPEAVVLSGEVVGANFFVPPGGRQAIPMGESVFK